MSRLTARIAFCGVAGLALAACSGNASGSSRSQNSGNYRGKEHRDLRCKYGVQLTGIQIGSTRKRVHRK